jgi:hypothetical protein
MPSEHTTKFKDKHGPDAKIDPSVADEIKRRISNDQLPCAVAFQVAQQLNSTPAAVGKTADLMNLKLTKCQLGLFGYTPHKKIINAQLPEPALKQAIMDKQKDKRIACSTVWEIASAQNQSKMTVSGACEALNIRIKPCQLGAF